MLTAIVRASLHRAKLVTAVSVLLLVLGATLIPRQTIDIFPPTAPARLSIVTDAPGMVSEQVEQLVTRPIEYAVIGAAGVAAVHSESAQGISVISIVLAPGADPYRTREAVSENLTLANGALPEGVGPAHLAPLPSSRGDLMTLGFTSTRLSSMDLRDIVQWRVRPQLLATPGIAAVTLFGGDVRRIEVRARSGDLADSDLGFADVIDAVHRATSVRGAGFIDTPEQRLLIEPHGQALDPEDVAAGQIHVTGGAPVRIGDVADVGVGTAPAHSDALVDGKPGILLTVAGQFGTNTVEATRKALASLDLLRPALAAQGVNIAGNSGAGDPGRPADFIDGTLRSVMIDLLIGALLIAVLLVILLRDWRAALISFLGIPLALLVALAALTMFGWTLNSMTVGGLVVALGLIADDAVIDVENIVSRLRNAELRHASRAHAVLLASLEVRAPVIHATLIIVIALLPVVLLGGPTGALLAPLAAIVIIACLAAIVIAATVTPALSLLFLNHLKPEPHPAWLHRIKEGYRARLAADWKSPFPILIGAAVALVAAAIVAAFFSVRLLPVFHDQTLVTQFDAPIATSLKVMRDYASGMTQALARDPDVAHVTARIGRADFGEMATGIAHGELDIALRPGLSTTAQDQAGLRVTHLLSAYRGITAHTAPQLESSAFGPDARRGVAVTIHGDDLDMLDTLAMRVAAILRKLPGAGAVEAQSDGLAPVVRVDINFQRLALYGLSAADVLSTIQTAFEGSVAAQTFDAGRSIDIAVTAEANVRRDPEAIGDLLIRSSQGISAPLKYIANVYLTDGRDRIAHDNGARRQIVRAEPTGDAQRFLEVARHQIANGLSLPAGTYLEYSVLDSGGPPANLLVNAAMSTVAVVALLLGLYADARACLFILGSTLFAAIGGIAAVALTGGVLSLGAFIGFVALFGISARNAILLLSRVGDILHSEHAEWAPATIFAAARDRLSPILISASVIIAGLLPLALDGHRAGLEILGPMSFVIIGGLVSATLLSLFLSPLLILWLWRGRDFLSERRKHRPAPAAG